MNIKYQILLLSLEVLLCLMVSCANRDDNHSKEFESSMKSDYYSDTNDSSSKVDSSGAQSLIQANETSSSLNVDSIKVASAISATSHKSYSNKKALIIGLGQQKDKSWAKINGDKDVPYVQKMLNSFGYGDIRTLVNKQATKAGIVSAFKSLSKDCSKGDIVYIHFSGHGQQVTDVNGDEIDKDGWDESWIPYDAYLQYGDNDKGEKHLIDDEINVLLNSIVEKIGENGKLMVVVDACHSGGSTRGESIRGDNGPVVRGSGANDTFNIPCDKKGKSIKPPVKWLTLSACDYYQVNQEIAKPQVGKLTYALYMTSQEGKANLNDITVFMDKYKSRLPQTPILAGKEFVKYDISDFLQY